MRSNDELQKVNKNENTDNERKKKNKKVKKGKKDKKEKNDKNEKNDENDKNDKKVENKKYNSGIYIFIQTMLIIIILFNIAIFLFSGINQLILFIPSVTSAIRIFIGFNNNIYDYVYKGQVLFIMCFICQIIKFIFRFILTYFIIKKNNHSGGNILDYNFIECKNVLWVNDFYIKINGVSTLIIFIVFFVAWLFIILLIQCQKEKFPKNKNSSKYEEIINLYYSCRNSQDNTNVVSII